MSWRWHSNQSIWFHEHGIHQKYIIKRMKVFIIIVSRCVTFTARLAALYKSRAGPWNDGIHRNAI